MKKMDKQNEIDSRYSYIGISSNKKKKEILYLLSYIKEIRDTAYPLKNSMISELKIDNFVARKEKDIILVNGELLLEDCDSCEKRSFEAYIMEINKNKYRVYLDVIREKNSDEPKMIRTIEEIDLNDKIKVITKYNQMEGIEEKTYTAEIEKGEEIDFYSRQNVEQLSVL